MRQSILFYSNVVLLVSAMWGEDALAKDRVPTVVTVTRKACQDVTPRHPDGERRPSSEKKEICTESTNWEIRPAENLEVYTALEVDKSVRGVEQSVASVKQQLETTETRMRTEVKDAIDKLPQRLLSEEAKKALKEAVLAELRAELAALRKDLQAQIDELKAGKSAKP